MFIQFEKTDSAETSETNGVILGIIKLRSNQLGQESSVNGEECTIAIVEDCLVESLVYGLTSDNNMLDTAQRANIQGKSAFPGQAKKHRYSHRQIQFERDCQQ